MSTINQQVTVKSEFTLHHDRTDDTIGLGTIDAGTGQQNFPGIDLSADTVGFTDAANSISADTLGQCNCMGEATFSMATATTITLVDFASALDRLGVALSGVTLKWMIVTINAPDGTKAIKIGPHGVSGACSFGLTGTTPALSVEHSMIFSSPQAGWAGTKIALANNSGVTVTGQVAYAGKR